MLRNTVNTNSYGCKHEKSLQGVSPDNGFNTAFNSVKPDQDDGYADCKLKSEGVLQDKYKLTPG